MIPVAILIGVIIGIVVSIIAMRRIGSDRAELAEEAAARLAANAAAEAEDQKNNPPLASLQIPTKKYQPKGQAMPKPVFLPTEAPTLLEEDPVVEWVPIGEGDFYNPYSGEIFHKEWS